MIINLRYSQAHESLDFGFFSSELHDFSVSFVFITFPVFIVLFCVMNNENISTGLFSNDREIELESPFAI